MPRDSRWLSSQSATLLVSHVSLPQHLAHLFEAPRATAPPTCAHKGEATRLALNDSALMPHKRYRDWRKRLSTGSVHLAKGISAWEVIFRF
jgi:hypothetical protein